jgi:hypothetical protein
VVEEEVRILIQAEFHPAEMLLLEVLVVDQVMRQQEQLVMVIELLELQHLSHLKEILVELLE